MKPSVEAFLDDIWSRINPVYEQESKRIEQIENWSRLHTGVNDYLKVSWKSGQHSSGYGTIYIDLCEPFDWIDSSYTVESGSYVADWMDLEDEALLEELYSALRTQVEAIFQSDRYGSRFFNFRMKLILELKRESVALRREEVLVNDPKLQALKEKLAAFVRSEVMEELPEQPGEDDDFFFARHLLNPLIQRLNKKYRPDRSRPDLWSIQCTSAFREWAEERFLPRYFNRTGDYVYEWELKEGTGAPDAEEMAFFLYAAMRISDTKPDTCKKYLELVRQLGSEQAANYLQQGSGRHESMRQGSLMQSKANDILQTIDIRIVAEEEAAYREALGYILSLLEQGFPKSYKLTLKSIAKTIYPLKCWRNRSSIDFFLIAYSIWPALFPLLAKYAEVAMKKFNWYKDVEPSEKSAMPGTYAVFGLGLYSDAYFPLVQRYMELVDTEYQWVQNGYGEAFVAAHGLSVQTMPVIISILLGGNDAAGAVKISPSTVRNWRMRGSLSLQ
ncbi:hypothetical protein YDYSY3_34450 [Paenibacillus chitinolyticus]|nr:hypothetical protein YDYSY3_34450 [Paenibacillus chitinolyticus]